MSCCAITNQLPPRAFLASTCLTLLFALTAVTIAQASSRAPLAPDSPSIPPSLSAVPLRSSFQPNSVWSPSIPYAVVCASGYLFVAVTAVRYPNLILQLNATTHSTLLTTSLTPPTLAVLNLVASTTSLFALTYDTTSYLTHSITQLSLTHLTPIRILSLGRSPSLLPLHLLGVDPAGSTLALALHLSPAVTRIDVATGRTLPPLTGNRSLQILGGAVDPLTGHVVIADRTSLSVLALTQDNATAWATQLPPSYTPDLSTCLASDAAGGYVYALFSTASPPCYSFTQYNLSTGAVVGEDCVDVEAITPQQQISAGAAHGEVWFVDVIGLSVNAEVSGRVSGFTVGQHPYLEDPAAIAVAGDGGVERVYVGVGQGVAELDAAGALVGMLWTENDHCTYSMLADVAVDAVGNVYAPICNGTIAVFSSQRVLLRSINLGSGVVPSSVSPSADGTSAYVKDDVHATRLSLYDLTSGKIMRTLSARIGLSVGEGGGGLDQRQRLGNGQQRRLHLPLGSGRVAAVGVELHHAGHHPLPLRRGGRPRARAAAGDGAGVR